MKLIDSEWLSYVIEQNNILQQKEKLEPCTDEYKQGYAMATRHILHTIKGMKEAIGVLCPRCFLLNYGKKRCDSGDDLTEGLLSMKRKHKCRCGKWCKLLGNEYVCSCGYRLERHYRTMFIVAGVGEHKKEFKIIQSKPSA